MTAVIFAGPSLPPDAGLPPGVRRLPPAGLGDVYRAATTEPCPRAIGLIDGYFEAVPAPRHKEILWALSQGIHVLGAASLGALRAAELAAYGMEPVGPIARAYIEGAFLGQPFGADDEVALLHGPAEIGYPALGEALVNMRATLAAAGERGVIAASTGKALVALAARRFFKQRDYPTLLADARAAGLPPDELDRLAGWLPKGRVDQKQADARELLARLAALQDAPPHVPCFSFEQTEDWLELVALAAPPASGPGTAAIEDQLRLDPPLRQALLTRALERLLLERETRRRGLAAGDAAALVSLYEPLLLRRLPELLAGDAEWLALRRVTAAAAAQLDAAADEAPSLADLGLTEAGLVAAHAAALGLPPGQDANAQALSLGFASADRYVAALLRQHLSRDRGAA